MVKQVFILLILIIPLSLSGQLTSIKDIQGEVSASPYANQTINTKGAVCGIYKDGYFIRENEEPWGSIYIYDSKRTQDFALGDTISLTGLVTEYYEWTEIKEISNFKILSINNPIPQPVVLQADEIDESWESCLVKIENTVCTNTDLDFGEWEVEDETDIIRIDDMGIAYSPELDQKYTIIGNIAYSFSAFKLEPRDEKDILILAPVFFIKQPYPVDIQKNEIRLTWESNTETSAGIFYGLTEDLEMDALESDLQGITHEVSIDNLLPASLIFAKAYCVLNEDTAFSKTMIFGTASESSGEIRVCFNRTNTNRSFHESPELFTDHLADTFIYYINKAEQTLDLALYDFTNHSALSENYSSGIAEAIYQAVGKGVQVRLITDADVADAAPADRELSIPRIEIDHEGIMHHKFIIVDHESINNSWIASGSTNPNYNNMLLDFNNLIAIQDQSLARAYLTEFDELWGGSETFPNLEISKSGKNKSDNSNHYFNIGGKRVELYFSPSDATTSVIADNISSATSDIDFAMMAFTENSIGNAILAANENGAEVKGIIDYVEYSGSEYNMLLNAGIVVLDYKNPDASVWPDGSTLHHKFAVVDEGTDKATVITGSHNWTASAESKNDENTLIIHDADIASLYKREVDRIYSWLQNPPVQPIAVNDSFELKNESSIVLNVLQNDITVGNINLEILKQAKFGTIEQNENSELIYTPNEVNVNFRDTIIYKIALEAYPFSDTALIVIFKNTNFIENIQKDIFRVYPNPADNFINIYFDSEATIPEYVEILDIRGKVILNSNNITPAYPCRIQSKELSPGVYIVVIHTDKGKLRQKIVKR